MKVSVLISTHRRADLLRKSLDSIMAQSRLPDEIVVVDDGDPTDSVAEVCKDFSLVRRIRRNNRQVIKGYSNPAVAFNMGLLAASGDIIVMQGADILWTRRTDLAFLVGPHDCVDNPKLVTLATCEKLDEPDGVHYPVHALENRSLLFNFGCAFRRQFALDLGGFHEGYEGWGYEDEDLASLMRRNGVSVQWFAPDTVLTHHQYHPWVPSSQMNTKRDRELFEKRQRTGQLSNADTSWGVDR